jgi:MFS family permease
MIHLPDELWLLGVGQALIGLFTPAGLCVGLSEMVDAVERVYPGQSRRVKALSSGFFNSMLGVGQILAPLYGTVSMQHLGFGWTNDIVALITLAFALVYLYAGGGWKAFGKTCRNRENEKN